jgi:ribosome-binding ATPase YchF (GTP1/OBG family)
LPVAVPEVAVVEAEEEEEVEEEEQEQEKGEGTHNMKSCSQLGWLPRTAMVVLFTFCTFSVTYVLNFSVGDSQAWPMRSGQG